MPHKIPEQLMLYRRLATLYPPSNGVRQQRQAWMAFHKQRTPQGEQNTVATPMSWPGCLRPPAGLRALEAGHNRRSISTAQPGLQKRTVPHGERLPPINNHQRTNELGRGSHHRTNINSQKNLRENNGFSATKWANHRSTQMPDDNSNTRGNKMPYRNPQEFKRAFPVPRQKRREKVVSLNEREAASLRRLQGIYANTKERDLRAERIKQTLKALQDKTLHTEVDESLREYQRKAEIDKGNRKELKRVRDNYYNDKKRRNSKTHISLNALESPQVSRHAYGLPEEGKEFGETQLVHKTEVKLKEIWQKAARRATVIDKFIQNTVKTESELHLPKIRVKRSPLAKSRLEHHEDESSNNSKSAHTDRSGELSVDVAMTELDAMSSVGSDFDDDQDDLTDIGEED